MNKRPSEMSAVEVTNPGLIPLSKGIYIYKPRGLGTSKDDTSEESVTGSTTPPPPPTVILLFTWMGAKLPHIQKYVESYSVLYPSATQIVVRSEASFFWSGEKAKRSYLEPVVQALELLGCLPNTSLSVPSRISKCLRAAEITRVIENPSPKILVHAFSNGGSWQLTTLSALLSESHPQSLFPRSVTVQPSAVILDSCPGNGGVSKTVAAFSSAIQSPILRAVVALGIRGLFLVVAIHKRLAMILYRIRMLFQFTSRASISPPSPPRTMIDILKDTLSSPTLLPGFTSSTPRLYLYSPADMMIPAEEVEAHAMDAEKRGLRVRKERFDSSPHVAHARMYPERYWAAVKEIWASANNDSGN